MSIKTIDKPMRGSAGIAKKINKGAEKMVFDILQSTQYSMPVQSTIRELVTNACDSQREKEVAIEILMGQKKVEDYYIERHGAQYEDSNFDINYYNRDHLDTASEIDLVYTKNEGVGYCDTFAVTDYGVGIGARRLEGILELGYSTKRNTSENFGAFGLGAKAALSTGVDFYTIETVYNGMRFKCNCYNYKTDFIIPAFNVKTGQQNPFVTFSDGTKVHYVTTDSTNQTTVSFGVKKHNRNKFEEAIEEQLMYFDNVNFKTVDSEDDNYTRNIPFKADILYNSKNLIVSDSHYYSKPHIVLVKDKDSATGINYGHIDFKELEMEQMYGSIAFKCPARQVVTNEDGTETVLQEGVDVTPSREKVIWNEATKNYIKGVIMSAAQEASDIIEKELQETDFLKWINACRAIVSGNNSENRILSRLARIVDTEALKPKFSPDPRIKYGPISKLFEGLTIMEPVKTKDEIKREVVKMWGSFDAKHFYSREDKWSKYKDAYLMNNPEDSYNPFHVSTYTLEDLDEKFESAIQMCSGRTDQLQKVMKERNRVEAKRNAVLKLIESSEWYNNYDETEVPEEWLKDYKEEEAQQQEKSKFSDLSPADRREIEKRIVAYTVRFDDKKDDNFTMDKIEPKTIDLMNSDYRTYYCTREDEDKMKAAAGLLMASAPKHNQVYPNSNWYSDARTEPVFWFDNPPVRFKRWNRSFKPEDGEYEKWAVPRQGWEHPQLIRVSQNKVKFIAKNPNVRHIDEFFLQVNDNNEYTVDKSLIKYYTAYKMDKINLFQFMGGLDFIHPELCEKYCNLIDLRNEYYGEMYDEAKQLAPDQIKHLDKLFEFQKFCNECDDEDMVKEKSKELFVLSDISNAKIADLDLLNQYDNIVEFAEEVEPMLNCISGIKTRKWGDSYVFNKELAKEIKIYLKAKARDVWE
tara:strand:- start:3279 stop:6035 length:2757 start_codon:yes stop_codon:yes gene_type:complete